MRRTACLLGLVALLATPGALADSTEGPASTARTPGSRSDPRGDDRGAPPDITSASSAYRGGWIVVTFVTADTVSSGHGGHPCLFAITRAGRNQFGFSAGCFEGPHTGMIYGRTCAHPDANDDCGSAHMSFPNGHTTVYRFRPAQIGNPDSFFWQAWVL